MKQFRKKDNTYLLKAQYFLGFEHTPKKDKSLIQPLN